VTAIRANGQVMWRFTDDDTIFGGIVIADLDRDGYLDVVTVGDSAASTAYWAGGRINVLSWDGRRKWVKKTDQVIWSSPVVADLKGDGTLDVIVGTGYFYPDGANTQPPFLANQVYALDAQGNDLTGWPYSTGTPDHDGRVFASPAVADLEGNGSLDVVVVDARGTLHAIRSNGSALWTVPGALNANSLLYTSPIIAYSSGQTQVGQLPDVIVADDTGHIKSFRGVQNPTTGQWTAAQQWALMDALPHYNAPAEGHFRGDGSWQLAIVAAGLVGGQVRSPSTLLLYDLDPTSLTPPWPEHRRDSSSNAVVRPIGFANALVTNLWQGALGRDPSSTELTMQAALLQHTGSLRSTFQSVVSSTEARSRQINAWYQTYLNRLPEDAGRASWLNLLAAGLTYADATSAIAGSPEAFAVAGGSNPAWVRQLYMAILQRTPADAEVNAWVNALNSLSRSQVASLFLHSVEYTSSLIGQWYRTYGLGNVIPAETLAALGWDLRRGKSEEQALTDLLTSNGDYVTTQQEGSYLRAAYPDVLQRAITPAETVFWLQHLENGTVSLANIAAVIVHSPEYHRVLATQWYQTYLNRTPSAAERDLFADALATQPHDALQRIFLQSDEYWSLAGSNPAGFVRKLYVDTLGRSASDAEVNARLGQFAGRDIRALMPSDMLHATEYYLHGVDGFYYLLLRRLTRTPPDNGRLVDPNIQDAQVWINSWATNDNPDDILTSILTSGEYQGVALYKAFWNGQRWLDVRF